MAQLATNVAKLEPDVPYDAIGAAYRVHVKIGSVGGASRQMMKEDHEMAASCIFSKREGGVDEASIS